MPSDKPPQRPLGDEQTEPQPQQSQTDPEGVEPTHVRSSAPRPGGPASSQVTPEAPGRYTLGVAVGRGGQATVYRAFDAHLERDVAMKVPTDSGDEAARERFLREARIAARLEHPNIVPVYEIGRRADGSVYSSQKLIRSATGGSAPRTLRLALQETRSLTERLALLPHVLGVCQGAAFAHSQGIVHRDLKPENVVLGSFGETVILDWGLAGEVARTTPGLPFAPPTSTTSDKLTIEGQAFGTPAYMSPEQARGGPDVGTRSDVWSLGVMVFEVLSGALPFVGSSPMETVRLVRDAPVPSLRQRARGAPPELIAIAERALQKDAAKRYATAAEVAADLTAYLAGRRVGVYAYGPFELLRLVVARNKLAAGVAAAAVLIVLAAAGFAFQKYAQGRVALAQALLERGREAERQLQWDRAAVLYAGARAYDDTPETRWAMRLTAGRKAPRVARLDGQPGPVKALAFTAAGDQLVVGGGDGTVHFYDFPGHAHAGTLRASARSLNGVAVSRDGVWIATAGEDGAVRLFRKGNLREERVLLSVKDAVNAVAFSPDSAHLAAGFEDGSVRLFELATGAEVFSARRPKAPVYAVAFAPGGQQLAWGDWSGRLYLRDLATAETREVQAHFTSVLDVEYSPDGALVATAGRDGAIRLWNADTGALRDSLEGHTQKVYALSFSPNGALLASGGTDRTVRLWDVRYRQALSGRSFNDGEDVIALAFTPDGKALALAGSSGSVRVRPLSAPSTFTTASAGSRIYALVASPDGRALFSTDQDTAALWDARSGEVLGRLSDTKQAGDVAFASLAPLLAWPNGGAEVCVAAPESLAKKQCFDLGDRAQSVAIDPEGHWVAGGGGDGLIRVWAIPSGDRLAEFRAHDNTVFALAASPDGKRLASGSYDRTIRVWDVETSAEKLVLKGHTHGVRRVAFSPDGKTLASASWDKTVRLWDTATGASRGVGDGHADHVFGLAWDPKGQWVASGAWDGTLRLWSAADARELGRAVADVDRIFALTVTPDGESLIYAGYDVHRLDLHPLASPEEDLSATQARWGLRLDGIALRPVGP